MSTKRVGNYFIWFKAVSSGRRKSFAIRPKWSGNFSVIIGYDSDETEIQK